MVRFKNRYILADYTFIDNNGPVNEKFLFKMMKEKAAEMLGELFVAKIAFSLQIKYMNLGKVVIRVSREQCTELLACLFIIKGLKVIRTSGTIRCIQTKIF